MTTAIGIDPGKDGFVVAVNDGGGILDWPTPTLKVGKTKRDYDVAAMVQILRIQSIGRPFDIVILEKQQAMPGQGVTSMFSVGHGYGLWEGILAGLGIPYRVVHPRTWQKVMLRDVAGTDTKGRSIIAAGRLFPTLDLRKSERARKPHNGKADAALMAWYGLHVVLGGQETP